MTRSYTGSSTARPVRMLSATLGTLTVSLQAAHVMIRCGLEDTTVTFAAIIPALRAHPAWLRAAGQQATLHRRNHTYGD